MFNIPNLNPDILCPDCRRPLVEIHKYQRAIDGDAAVLGDPIPIPQRSNGGEIFFLLAIFDMLLDGILGFAHKIKAKRLCARELRTSPNSLICPACLFVLRRP